VGIIHADQLPVAAVNVVKIKLEELCKLKQDLAALRLTMQKKIGVRFVPILLVFQANENHP